MGYSETENTWADAAELAGCEHVVKRYLTANVAHGTVKANAISTVDIVDLICDKQQKGNAFYCVSRCVATPCCRGSLSSSTGTGTNPYASTNEHVKTCQQLFSPRMRPCKWEHTLTCSLIPQE